MRGLALVLATLALASGWPTPAARAQALVADLTNHLIAITTGFTGTEVVLFGAIEGEGDVIVVVRGPETAIEVRRKERTLGVWLNRSDMTFADVPSFYAIASTRPIEQLARPEVLTRYRIGVDHLALEAADATDQVEQFRQALIRNKQRESLFPTAVGTVTFVGSRLFRTTVAFPANVPTGSYQVSVFLMRNGQVQGAQTTPLLVSQLGLSADIVDFAYRRALLYGLIAVFVAAMAGWLGSVAFRRV
ncbi:MAG: TIGR02186 family protein [Proteobacteria bacterium]|nr:TIGR02186 family protein [Pseudomonadota bacterium]